MPADVSAIPNAAPTNGSRCVLCGRPLKDPASLSRGMGQVCAGKAGKSDCGALFGDSPVLNGVGTLEEVGLVCRRLADGRLACNVQHVVKHHSPTGFECGFGGSGPAELALNVLHQLMPPKGDHMDRLFGSSVVSNDAAHLHQEFKWRFISSMPSSGGFVPIENIYEWLIARFVAEAA